MGITLITLALLAAGNPTAPTSKSVAEAKRSLFEAADKSFLETWDGDEAYQAGITAQQARTLARWTIVGVSLGVCRPFASSTIQADWLARIEQIGLTPETSAMMREKGLKAWRDSGASMLGDITPAQHKAYCTVELAAVRLAIPEL